MDSHGCRARRDRLTSGAARPAGRRHVDRPAGDAAAAAVLRSRRVRAVSDRDHDRASVCTSTHCWDSSRTRVRGIGTNGICRCRARRSSRGCCSSGGTAGARKFSSWLVRASATISTATRLPNTAMPTRWSPPVRGGSRPWRSLTTGPTRSGLPASGPRWRRWLRAEIDNWVDGNRIAQRLAISISERSGASRLRARSGGARDLRRARLQRRRRESAGLRAAVLPGDPRGA